MTVAETANQWLKRFPKLSPDIVMGEFLLLLGEAWEAKKYIFTTSHMEDSITDTLAIEIIRRVRDAKNISWSVRPQSTILIEQGDGAGKVIGRCDLIIDLGGNREYIQECKRLWPEGKSSTFTTSARLYVEQGLLRFLKPSEKHSTAHAQYGSWQGFAGMIAYVMDGRTLEACETVRKVVAPHTLTPPPTDPYPAPCPATKAFCFRSNHLDCQGNSV